MEYTDHSNFIVFLIITAISATILVLIVSRYLERSTRKITAAFKKQCYNEGFNDGYKKGSDDTIAIKTTFLPANYKITKADREYINEIGERLKFRLATEFNASDLTDQMVDNHFDNLLTRFTYRAEQNDLFKSKLDTHGNNNTEYKD